MSAGPPTKDRWTRWSWRSAATPTRRTRTTTSCVSTCAARTMRVLGTALPVEALPETPSYADQGYDLQPPTLSPHPPLKPQFQDQARPPRHRLRPSRGSRVLLDSSPGTWRRHFERDRLSCTPRLPTVRIDLEDRGAAWSSASACWLGPSCETTGHRAVSGPRPPISSRDFGDATTTLRLRRRKPEPCSRLRDARPLCPRSETETRRAGRHRGAAVRMRRRSQASRKTGAMAACRNGHRSVPRHACIARRAQAVALRVGTGPRRAHENARKRAFRLGWCLRA